jgi:hypothetical protein
VIREILTQSNFQDVVVPGLCKRLLHNCALRPSYGERAHVFQVAGREALHIGERLAQVGCQAIDHLRASARAFLSVGDRPSNVPAEKDHCRIGGQNDAQSFLLDACLDRGECLGVLLRKCCLGRRNRETGFGPGAVASQPGLLLLTCGLTGHSQAPSHLY